MRSASPAPGSILVRATRGTRRKKSGIRASGFGIRVVRGSWFGIRDSHGSGFAGSGFVPARDFGIRLAAPADALLGTSVRGGANWGRTPVRLIKLAFAPIHDTVRLRLRIADCGLRIADCGLRIAPPRVDRLRTDRLRTNDYMAARATWKGFLKISLVNIPIK